MMEAKKKWNCIFGRVRKFDNAVWWEANALRLDQQYDEIQREVCETVSLVEY